MSEIPPETALDAPRGGKIGLRTALSGLVIATVTATVMLIHVSWSYTARQNVNDVVAQLNRQIIDSIHRELHGVFDGALSTQEAVRTIFFQDTIQVSDERNREFVFLSWLRAQPSVSWVSLGFPDGGFIGAHKVGDTEIDMVEVKWNETHTATERRIDYYTPDVGDIVFDRREIAPTSYNVTSQPWYARAAAEQKSVWSMVSSFPDGERQSIATATPLIAMDQKFVAVITVVIGLDRLSQFLVDLRVGKSGTALLVDGEGKVIASADPRAIAAQQVGRMPDLAELGRDNRLLRVVHDQVARPDLGLATLSETRQIEALGPGGESYFVTFAPLGFEGWVVATVIPASDFLATIERNARLLLVGVVVVTVMMALLAVGSANRWIALPLLSIADQLKHIESFNLAGITRLASPLRELDNFSAALMQMSRGLASFQKYMPTTLVRTLVARGVEAQPGGHEAVLTVLFSDIDGFTRLSEELGDDVVPLLTDYLEQASAAIIGQGGTIDKFIGDAVMAFWGAPVPDERHAVAACAAALDFQRRLAGRDRLPPLRTRIGINTGRMLVGNIGSNERLSYTVIGDSVNVASRLEALNKRYGTEIIIGPDTRHAAGDAIVVRRLDQVAVYGRVQGMAIYELLGMAGEYVAPAWVSAYESGLEAFGERRWQAAIALFQAAEQGRGGDLPATMLIERCSQYVAAPPADDWVPVIMLDSK